MVGIQVEVLSDNGTPIQTSYHDDDVIIEDIDELYMGGGKDIRVTVE